MPYTSGTDNREAYSMGSTESEDDIGSKSKSDGGPHQYQTLFYNLTHRDHINWNKIHVQKMIYHKNSQIMFVFANELMGKEFFQSMRKIYQFNPEEPKSAEVNKKSAKRAPSVHYSPDFQIGDMPVINVKVSPEGEFDELQPILTRKISLGESIQRKTSRKHSGNLPKLSGFDNSPVQVRSKSLPKADSSSSSESESSDSGSKPDKEESSEETEGEAEQMKKLVHLNSIQMTKPRKNIIKLAKIKAQVGFRVNKEKQLRCVDVVFALMTKNLNSMSEIVYNFTRETKILNNFVENISFDEKRSMTMRAYNSLECAI